MTAKLQHQRSQWAAVFRTIMVILMVAGLLAACADRPQRTPPVADAIRAELSSAVPPTKLAVPARISDALAEPAQPPVQAPPEPRLDLLVNNAQAREVFLAIVADTRYSMLMHPDVSGTLSVTLRGVTVKEALEAIRDVYGYDFKIEGRRITVYAPTLQTRIFTINYPLSLRDGRSELRVTSGATSPATPAATGAAGVVGAAAGQPAAARLNESSRVSTSSKTDFWTELADAVRSMISKGDGRNVVVSPQAGIMAVRAMPDELRQIEKFLKAAQLAVERQVMLEAKIVEVELRDSQQSGINWGAMGTGTDGTAIAGLAGSGVTTTNPFLQAASGANVAANPSIVAPIPAFANGGGVFGLALATTQFGVVMGFLETQGDVQTLSSPRVATLNNQKAVLKVGSDDYFLTNISGGSTSSTGGNTTTTLPNLILAPFFSGIALDVTPQIDDGNSIMLHIHPAVSSVVEKTKEIDLGSIGLYKLPLASSSMNETDTMVRLQDGNIVAIGGLMQMVANRNASGIPGTTGSSNPFGFLLGNRANSSRKKEVVVLIKPSIIRTAQDWEDQTQRSRAALDDIETARSRVIRLDGTVKEPEPKATTQ